MVGGVLIEQTVKDVIQDLEKNYELVCIPIVDVQLLLKSLSPTQIQKAAETYQAKMTEKGTAITEYVKANNLMGLLRGSADSQSSETKPESSEPKTGSVLV